MCGGNMYKQDNTWTCEQSGYGRRLRQVFGVQDVHEAAPDADEKEPTA